MLVSAYNYRVTAPGEETSLTCRACGRAMRVVRNVFGPTSWASAVGGRRYWRRHDAWRCPHSAEHWHVRVLKLRQEADATVGLKVRSLLEEEINEILAREAT
jgi:hypothetical protein